MIARQVCCVAFAIVGCYAPSYVDCQIQCGAESSCPSGLTCDMKANACRSSSTLSCLTADAGPVDAEACLAWRGLLPASNFDPCNAFPPPGSGDLNIQQSATLSTTDGTFVVGTNTPITLGVAYNNMWLIHEPSITIDNVVLVTGTAPLLLVADTTITVSFALDVRATTTNGDISCAAPDAGAKSPVGGGGGGGGYGSDGASGGAESGSAAQSGQTSNGSVTLIPLRFGCGGGAGGSPDGAAPGGAGGDAGAALELAAGTSIVITSQGTLTATGGGGGAGSTGTGYSSGGGGGGTGGSILLEAPTLEIDGAVCAPGGGGGEGAADAGATPSMGNDGTCAGGQGGANGSTGGPGGNGGDNSALSGYGGASSTDSGGGGGGSVGRIHFNASPTGLTVGSGAIVPTQQ